MRKCAYCDKEELFGVGSSNTPVCETHFEQYLARQLAPLKGLRANCDEDEPAERSRKE